MQGRFNIWNSFYVTHYTERITKNFMINSMDTKKAFDKSQPSFMMKEKKNTLKTKNIRKLLSTEKKLL